MGANEFEDMVGDAIETAEQEGADGGEGDAPTMPQGGRVDEPGDAAPEAAAPWQMPQMSQQDFEALQKRAELGREFEPDAQAIREARRRAFLGGQQGAQQAAPAAAPKRQEEDDGYDRIMSFPGYQEWWEKKVPTNPKEYERGILAMVNRAHKGTFEKVGTLEKTVAEQRDMIDHLLGFEMTAGKRFQQTEEWKLYGEKTIAAIKSGKILDWDTAWDAAKNEAKAQGATPAQAAAAGKRAAQATQGGAQGVAARGTGEPRRAPPKAGPRPEASLHESRGHSNTASGTGRPRFDRNKAGSFEKDIMSAAWKKAGGS